MSDTTKRKTRRVGLRLTEDEYQEILVRARMYTDGNVNRYITQVAAQGQVKVVHLDVRTRQREAALYDLIREYRKVGVNYNQVVRAVNARRSGDGNLLVKALDELSAKTDRLIELTRKIGLGLEGRGDGNQD